MNIDKFNPGDLVFYGVTGEYGIVSSKNDKLVFVKYFFGSTIQSTSQATDPSDLQLVREDEWEDRESKIKIFTMKSNNGKSNMGS